MRVVSFPGGWEMALENDSVKEDEEALKEFLADSECLEPLSKWTHRFNAFDVLGIADAEIRHSNVLAWLMDPAENHGLQDGVIRGFVDYVAKCVEDDGTFDDLLMDCNGFSIRREWCHIDILAVNDEEKYVLCIENKIFSGEHDDQLARYRGEVEKEFPDYRRRFVFLTPNSWEASEPEWLAMGYKDVLDIIGRAVRSSTPAPEPAQFISEYMDTVRRNILGDEKLERVCSKIYAKHKRALDLIFEYKSDMIPRISKYCREWARRNSGPNGKIMFDEKDCAKHFIRFKTELMSQILPDADEPNSGWKSRSNYFYEINIQDGDDGPEMRCQLCFSSKGLDGRRREIYGKVSQDQDSPCLEEYKDGKNDWWRIHWLWPLDGKFLLVHVDFDEEWLNNQLNDMFEQLEQFEKELSERQWVKDLLADASTQE